ncbi:MAG: undecaprenyl/decaprenyl-phosphate alpha-N-acetylglucosaminyl 1-phosphate transferase [Planctomycetes bacterium]|nr:undecaprenyl/decaprenyl-phosphate alpha-N-acetylglucosaminyl 1-phosphate transferase [Planctomycetota bacterium]
MPSMPHPAAAAALALVLVAVGTWCNRRWFGWLPDDLPRAGRKQHARPMPLAGILVVPAALPWLLDARSWWLLAGFVLAAAVGFVDDWQKEREREYDWRGKALGLGLAAALAAIEIAPPLDAPWLWLAAALFVFVLSNATNFLDNTDGVAPALAAVSLLMLGAGGGPAGAIGFAALGFLPWNWPQPRAFLGDAGAYALGLATGVFAASAARHDPIWLLAVAVQLADFGQVVVARLWLGLPPWVGDRRHLTHIAQNLGLPRRATAPTFAAIALLLALGARL